MINYPVFSPAGCSSPNIILLNMRKARNITAPFQTSSYSCTQSQESNFISSSRHITFKNFVFPPLQNVLELEFAKYCGPTPESNWVIPGLLLVGAYPASANDDETFDLITSILKHGITKFVCLQSEYIQNASVADWRSGAALRPYFEDVKEIVSHRSLITEFQGCTNIVDDNRLQFEHCPIVDCGVTDDFKVLDLAYKLVKDISVGEIIYLHCWGGHGRTGTIVCIMLHLMYGMDAVEAFCYCQSVHDLRSCPVDVGSPQTQSQRCQVIRVIDMLKREYESTPPETKSDNKYIKLLYEQIVLGPKSETLSENDTLVDKGKKDDSITGSNSIVLAPPPLLQSLPSKKRNHRKSHNHVVLSTEELAAAAAAAVTAVEGYSDNNDYVVCGSINCSLHKDIGYDEVLAQNVLRIHLQQNDKSCGDTAVVESSSTGSNRISTSGSQPQPHKEVESCDFSFLPDIYKSPGMISSLSSSVAETCNTNLTSRSAAITQSVPIAAMEELRQLGNSNSCDQQTIVSSIVSTASRSNSISSSVSNSNIHVTCDIMSSDIITECYALSATATNGNNNNSLILTSTAHQAHPPPPQQQQLHQACGSAGYVGGRSVGSSARKHLHQQQHRMISLCADNAVDSDDCIDVDCCIRDKHICGTEEKVGCRSSSSDLYCSTFADHYSHSSNETTTTDSVEGEKYTSQPQHCPNVVTVATTLTLIAPMLLAECSSAGAASVSGNKTSGDNINDYVVRLPEVANFKGKITPKEQSLHRNCSVSTGDASSADIVCSNSSLKSPPQKIVEVRGGKSSTVLRSALKAAHKLFTGNNFGNTLNSNSSSNQLSVPTGSAKSEENHSSNNNNKSYDDSNKGNASSSSLPSTPIVGITTATIPTVPVPPLGQQPSSKGRKIVNVRSFYGGVFKRTVAR